MNPDEKKLLEDTARLSQENNLMLKKVYNHLMMGRIFRIIYWVVIIGASVGAFYLIQPYIDSLKSAMGSDAGTSSDTSSPFDNLLGF
jgi:hypothetical protein